MSKIIFIDTNIYLDFYRFRNSDISMKYLDIIDNYHEKIITSSQVEMEFKKHRIEEIRKTYESITTPNWQSLTSPAILTNSEPAKIISKKKKEIEKQLKILRSRIIKLIESPSINDKVYQSLQRLFKDVINDINLHRGNNQKYRIRKLALKRFYLGYPPRKKDDTSIGDSINWEWIIDCASRHKSDVIIVSRDNDFGQFIHEKSFINDWLSYEFKERVNKRKKIILTNQLTFAFKEVISRHSVTKEMEEAEREIIIKNQLDNQKTMKSSLEEIKQYTSEEQIFKLREVLNKLNTNNN